MPAGLPRLRSHSGAAGGSQRSCDRVLAPEVRLWEPSEQSVRRLLPAPLIGGSQPSGGVCGRVRTRQKLPRLLACWLAAWARPSAASACVCEFAVFLELSRASGRACRPRLPAATGAAAVRRRSQHFDRLLGTLALVIACNPPAGGKALVILAVLQRSTAGFAHCLHPPHLPIVPAGGPADGPAAMDYDLPPLLSDAESDGSLSSGQAAGRERRTQAPALISDSSSGALTGVALGGCCRLPRWSGAPSLSAFLADTPCCFPP